MCEADKATVREALEEFLTAFDNLHWERFRRCFASDATVFFPQNLHPHRLYGTMEVETVFKNIFDETRTRVTGPPYLNLVPHDMNIQVWQDVALVTFHLDRPSSLGRRTLVLHRQAQQWQIVHLHASVMTLPNT